MIVLLTEGADKTVPMQQRLSSAIDRCHLAIRTVSNDSWETTKLNEKHAEHFDYNVTQNLKFCKIIFNIL
jgi:hypothetical protein